MKLIATATLGLFLTACGGGGSANGSGGSPGGSVSPPPPTVTPPAPAASYSLAFTDTGRQPAVGSYLSVELTGAAITNVAKVSVDGKQSGYTVFEDRLFVPTSALAAGQHTITVEVGAEKASSNFTLQPTVLPTAPVAFLANYLRDVQADLTARVASASGAELSSLTSLQADLAAQQTALNSMDEAKARDLALSLHAAFGPSLAQAQQASPVARSLAAVSPTGSASYQFNEPGCKAAQRDLVAWVVISAGTIPFMFSPEPLSKVLAAGIFIGAGTNAARASTDVVHNCVTDGESLSLQDTVTKTPITLFEMTHDASRQAALRMKAKLSTIIEDSIIGKVQWLSSIIDRVRTVTRTPVFALPDNFGEPLRHFERVQTVPAVAGGYFIGNISDARIEGEQYGSTDVSTVKFRFRKGQMPTTAVKFTFDLIRGPENKVMGTYTAVLSPVPLPIATSQNISASPGVTYSGLLSGLNADTYEITQQPVSGVLNMYNNVEGKFTYTVNSGVPVQTTDTFKFVAVNQAGKSAESTVSIKVDMLAALKAAVVGNWLVTNLESNPRTTYSLTMRADGTGAYNVNNTTYGIAWNISPNRSNEYALFEGGFWHPGYNNLDRDGLTLPLTNFYTYSTNPATNRADPTKPALHYVKQ